MKNSLLLIFVCYFAMSSAQNVYEKDPTWNTYELPNNQYFVDGSNFVKSEFQSDGKLIVAVTNHSSVPETILVRLDGNQRDTTFLSGNFNGVIKDFLIQPDGKIVVVGTFTTYEGIAAKYLVRLNTDGTRDNSFVIGSSFTFITFSNKKWANVVKIQPDGKLLVGGEHIISYNGQAINFVARINQDGSLDPTLIYDPAVGLIGAQNIAIQPDGKIIVVKLGVIYRILADGTLDPDWTRNSISTFSAVNSNPLIYSIVVLPNEKIVVGGEFDSAFNISTIRNIVGLNANGSRDLSFYSRGFQTVVNSISIGVTSMVALADGKIIVGGDFSNWSIDSNTVIDIPNLILRLNSNGTLDTSFNGDNINSGVIRDIKMTPDGKLICVGNIRGYNSVAVNNIVRIDTDGNRDSTFHNICKGFNGPVKKILQQPNGKILVSGYFSMYNGFTRIGLVRINEDGSIDESLNANGYIFDFPDLALQDDGKILVASTGSFFDDGYQGGSLLRLNSDGSLDTSFVSLTPGDYGLSGRYTCVRVQPDGKIITVGKTGSSTDIAIKRFNEDYTNDTTFNYTYYNNCGKVAIQPDGKILFTFYEGLGIDNYRMGRLLPDGQIDTSFNAPTTTPGVTNFTLQPDGKILCFSDSYGHTVFRLNADGSLDTGFSFPTTSTFQNENTAHALLPDGKILMGVRLFSVFPNYLIRRNSDGSADTSFNIGSGFDQDYAYSQSGETIADVDVDSYGRILVGGEFSSFNGQPENSFVRLQPQGFLSTPVSTKEQSFVIYPNPAKDTIHISIKNGKKVDKVSLFTISGTLITSVSDTNIDVSNLENGFYIIKISSGNEIEQYKLIKN